jgi:hypothetical protein
MFSVFSYGVIASEAKQSPAGCALLSGRLLRRLRLLAMTVL